MRSSLSVIDSAKLCAFSSLSDHGFVWYVKLSRHVLCGRLYDSLSKLILNDCIILLEEFLFL